MLTCSILAQLLQPMNVLYLLIYKEILVTQLHNQNAVKFSKGTQSRTDSDWLINQEGGNFLRNFSKILQN